MLYEPEDFVLNRERIVAVESVLKSLRPRQEIVVRMRWGLEPYDRPHLYKEIAKELGVSVERTRQMEARTFHDIRRNIKQNNELKNCI
jgi:RNA polymerase primary sigma factor